jgi:hypothetical protein
MNHWQKWAMAVLGGVALAAALALVAVGGWPEGEALALAQGTIYVDADAAGANDGSSWQDAHTTLQPAQTEVTAPEATIVGGTITTDTTWTVAGSPYILQTQNVTVLDNVRLTIEAGVAVEFNAGRSLWVYGTLLAEGTPTQPITFTRMVGATQPWATIQIGGGSVVTDSNTSLISYATIEGGGSSSQMLYVYYSAPAFDHLTVRNSTTRGVYATGMPAGSTLAWDTGTVTGNATEGVYIYTGRAALSQLTVAGNGTDGVELNSADDSQVLNTTVQDNGGNGIHSSGSDRLLLEGLTISGNAGYGVYMQLYGEGSILRDTTVEGNGVAARLHPDVSLENVSWTGNTRSEVEWIAGHINSSRTWARLPEIHTYRVLEPVTVVDNTTLTVEPGVTVGIQAGTNLYINGSLSAVGTPTQPITLTRTAGATQPWGYLQIGGGSVVGDSDASQVSYATIEGGGSGGQMLYVYRSAPTLDHFTLRNSSGKGVYVGNVSTDSPVSWDTGAVTGSTGEGVYVAAGRVALSNLNIANNGAEGVELNSADDSQLLNSTVQGNGGEGIRSSGSDRLLLEGLTIAGNTGYGIYVQFDGAGGGVGSIVRDTTVQSNGVAARLHPDTLLDNVSWTGNTRSEIEWITGRINSSRTWARLPEISTYRVLGDITAPDNTRLSVEPGVTVEMQEYVSLYTPGGFSAVGTPAEPITITRIPGATHPWGMIEIGSGNVQGDSDDSRVSYATIEGGGSEGKLVHLYYTSATMDHVTVRDGSSIGIQVSPWAGTQVTMDTVAVTNNAGVAIYHNQPGPSLSYRGLTLQGNGTDAVSIGSGSIATLVQWDLADAGVPVRSGSLYVHGGGFLALMPGTRLEFTAAAQLQVWSGSALYALGSPDSPITLTGELSQPGGWKGVWQQVHSRAILRNCNIEYGGAGGEPALKIQSPHPVLINSNVRHAAADGVFVDTATPPVLRQDDISDNAFGMRNNRPAAPVDARYVWWGDASGPYHAALNPGGLGNAVSDGVLFEPWLTDVPTGTVPPTGLIVRAAGPHAASPGQSVILGAAYLNETGQEIHDAVLTILLPIGAEFVEAYPASSGEGRGIYWSDRHEVFWRLGTLPPGAGGTVAVRVRYYWGLPAHTDGIMVMLAGSNQGPTAFDLASYLAYVPVDALSTTALTPADVALERQLYPAVDEFYVEGEAQGFVYHSAVRYTITGERPLVAIRLDRPDGSAVMQIMRIDEVVQAYVVDASSFTLRTVVGDAIYDRATATYSFTGELAGGGRGALSLLPSGPVGAGSTPPGSVSDPLSYADNWAGGSQMYPTFGECYANCIEETTKKLTVAGIKRWMLGLPPLSKRDVQNAWELYQCEKQCEEDPTSHYCIEDEKYCLGIEVWGGLAGIAEHRIMRKICDKETGLWEPGEAYVTTCPWHNPRQKCIYGPDEQPLCANCGEGTGRDCNTVDVSTPKDPNAKYGLAGDLLPGDVVSYTVTYENVGQGIAYGVYVEDRLSEEIDQSTLVIGGGGLYMPATRTIVWDIGELGPAGSPTASGSVTFTAQLHTGLPGGTPIINQAVVYFPSAPEVTPTNQVVNVIWPVVGVPMTVTVEAGHSVPVTLAGRDTGQGPLTFRVVDPPVRGTLSGTPPYLTYTAATGYAWQDLLTFSVSNTITESRPAEVTALVVPDPDDTTPPTVRWTTPVANAVVSLISASPAFTDSIGPVYMPYVIASFDETIDASTVTTATLLLTGDDGTAIPLTVSYEGTTNEAVALLRQPLEPATRYTVRATQGIRDLAGNPLAADYVWTFCTAGGTKVYLPLVTR